MTKIKDLLKQLGASEELTESILNELKDYRETTRQQLDEEFIARLEKAKQVCLEEFGKEKTKLARKVEVFLESRVNAIDREAQKQSAIGESEATKTLRDMKCLIEGVDIGSAAKDVQAVKGEMGALRHRLGQVMEEKTQFKEQAQRANQIAMKALERNKVLESTTSGQATVTESKKTKEPAKLESLRTAGGKPKTQRRVLTETVARESKTKYEPQSTPDVQKIAASIDDSPAYVS